MSNEKYAKRRRNIFMALTIVFVALSLSFGGGSEGIWILWRDYPAIAAICLMLAIVMGLGWWRAARETGRQRSGRSTWLGRILIGGAGLVLVSGLTLVAAYNRDLYTGHPPHQGTLIIQGGTLFDGTGAAPRENAMIVIENDRIVCVGHECEAPRDAPVIDATGLSILPGLIDLHVHFYAPAAECDEYKERSFPSMMWDFARQRPGVRRAFHEAGVTSIRSMGDPKDSIVKLKAQVASGELAGPRVYCVGPIFTAPRGHPAGTIFKNNSYLIKNATRQVSEPNEARSEVEKLAREGVDGIKAVYDDAGGRRPTLSPDVLQAIVDEAHKHNLWVAVHTGSDDDVLEAIRAGADTIEHGVTRGERLDRDTARLLNEHNVIFVPTLAVFQVYTRPESMKSYLDNVRTAKESGVRIGTGTDTNNPKMIFGRSVHRELELLVQAGLTPGDALLSATGNAARALHVDKDLGTIEPNKLADIVVVEGQPWEQITDIGKIQLVIQAGRVVVDKRTSAR